MAKRASGATEINGFISVKPDKTTKTSKTKEELNKHVSRGTLKAKDETNKQKKGLSPQDKGKESSTKPTVKLDKPRTQISKAKTEERKPSTERKVVTKIEKKDVTSQNKTKPIISRTSTISKSTASRKADANDVKKTTLGRSSTKEKSVPLNKTPKAETPKTSSSLKSSSSTSKKTLPSKTAAKVPHKDVKKKVVISQPPTMPPRQRTWVKEEEEKEKLLQERKEKTEAKDQSNIAQNVEITVPNDSAQGMHGNSGPTNSGSLTDGEKKPTDKVETEDNVLNKVSEIPQPDEDCDYEDDFEDYESDFEEYLTESGVSSSLESDSQIETDSSSENSSERSESSDAKSKGILQDERKMDSGNYDLRRSRQLSDSTTPSIVEDDKTVDNNSTTLDKTMYPKEEDLVNQILGFNRESNKGKQAINKKREHQTYETQKPKSIAALRGEKLMKMIKLDITSINLLEMSPIPYDVFIKMYGKKNTMQRSTQTNEDNSEQEVQTDEILQENKWTQHPVAYHRWSNSVQKSMNLFFQDKKGSGNDLIEKVDISTKAAYNVVKLNNFLNYASEVMNIILEEEGYLQRGGNVKKNKTDLGFSDGFIFMECNGALPFLKGRKVKHLTFSPHNANHMLTVFEEGEFLGKSLAEDIYQRCIICIWNILEPSTPQKTLVSSNQVLSVSFDQVHTHLLYAGCDDGSVSVWDLSERNSWHSRAYGPESKDIIRTPTYSTSQVMGNDGHTSPVISILSLTYSYNSGSLQNFSPAQVVSLEETGKLILWTVLQTPSNTQNNNFETSLADLGLSYWGKIRLVLSVSVHLSASLPKYLRNEPLFTCMAKSPIKDMNVLVGNDSGHVIHYAVLGLGDENTTYKNKEGDASSVTCIEPCPNNQGLFLVGCLNGVIRLHQMNRSRPLRMFLCDFSTIMPPLVSIRWSSQRPGLFFAGDQKSMLHVWNICRSDLSPLFSIPFKGQNLCLTALTTNGKSSYYAMAIEGKVEVHKIKKEFTTNNEMEERIFSTYITLL